MFFKKNRSYNEVESQYVSTPVPQEEKPDEHFRIGVTADGRTTLTLTDGYTSMTLTMNRLACEQLIRMIQASYPNAPTEEPTVEEQQQ